MVRKKHDSQIYIRIPKGLFPALVIFFILPLLFLSFLVLVLQHTQILQQFAAFVPPPGGGSAPACTQHCTDGQSCSNAGGQVVNGTCGPAQVCCQLPAAPPVTPAPPVTVQHYACSGNMCVASSGGPYTSSNCNGACLGGGKPPPVLPTTPPVNVVPSTPPVHAPGHGPAAPGSGVNPPAPAKPTSTPTIPPTPTPTPPSLSLGINIGGSGIGGIAAACKFGFIQSAQCPSLNKGYLCSSAFVPQCVQIQDCINGIQQSTGKKCFANESNCSCTTPPAPIQGRAYVCSTVGLSGNHCVPDVDCQNGSTYGVDGQPCLSNAVCSNVCPALSPAPQPGRVYVCSNYGFTQSCVVDPFSDCQVPGNLFNREGLACIYSEDCPLDCPSGNPKNNNTNPNPIPQPVPNPLPWILAQNVSYASGVTITPPDHQTRTLTAYFGSGVSLSSDSNVLGAQIYRVTGTVTYDINARMFGNPQLDISQVPPGSYYILIHMDGFLDELLTQPDGSKTFTIPVSQSLQTALLQTSLAPGDVAQSPDGYNKIDILDYNAVLSCLGKPATGVCQSSDITDNGVIDQLDLEIVKANFGAVGESFVDPNYTCVQDPSCKTGNGSLQLCTLKCTRNRLNY